MERMLTLVLLCPFVFLINVTSGQVNVVAVCSRPETGPKIEVAGFQRYFRPGTELVLNCEEGHTPILGPRTIVCKENGEWTQSKLLCIPKRCPTPDLLPNGELYYEDIVYQSTINYTCHEGYTLAGASTSECLANGTWTSGVPKCKPVTCGPPPIPQNGMVVHEQRITGNITNYGTRVTYRCRPPFVVFGDVWAECTANGTWTKTPECKVVTCPPPESIDNGYSSTSDKRPYDYMETVNYGCSGDYVLEGSFQSVCQEDGNWSERPSCRAPCRVDLKRGRILYKGQRIWIADLTPNRILHKEIMSVYCLDKARNCGYPMPTQCINGKLQIPECYEVPSHFTYNLKTSSLPSEMTQC